MSNVIVDLSNKSDLNPKIFLGNYDNVLRVDNISSHAIKVLKENSEGNTWFTKELDFGSDAVKMAQLDPIPKRIFQLNIGYQTVMDSGVSNGYLDTISPMMTDSIYRLLYRRIGIEECIHAESYSYALEQIFKEKAQEFLDIIYTDPFIRTRMNEEIDAFAEVDRLRRIDDIDPDVLKKAILKMIVQTYLLEGIKFPFSFFVTFTINKSFNNAIQGVARLIKLIAHDELTLHVPANLHLLKVLRNDSHQGFKHLFDSGWFDEMSRDTARLIETQEISWLGYLLRDGTIPGLNQKIGEHFIKYWTNFRLQGIKVEKLDNTIESNDLIQWYEIYKDINKTSTAGQEAGNIGYVKGGLMNDMDGEW